MTDQPPKPEHVQDDDAVVDQPVEQVFVDEATTQAVAETAMPASSGNSRSASRARSLLRTPKRAALKRMRRRTHLKRMPRQHRKPTAAQRSLCGSRNWRSPNLLPVRSPNSGSKSAHPFKGARYPSACLTTTSPAKLKPVPVRRRPS